MKETSKIVKKGAHDNAQSQTISSSELIFHFRIWIKTIQISGLPYTDTDENKETGPRKRNWNNNKNKKFANEGKREKKRCAEASKM